MPSKGLVSMVSVSRRSEVSSINKGDEDVTLMLRDASAAERFYNHRYQQGYMDDEDWSDTKLARVGALIAELGLPSRGTLIDFGCGTGVFTAILACVLPGWTVYGTDISDTALVRARTRVPNGSFISLSDCISFSGRFDLIFTHHVLEHVSDLTKTVRTLESILVAGGTMVHILPCGNAGSLAHRICTMTRNGIEADSENRFFFEEEGHLRRLTTEGLLALWRTRDFRLVKAYYAEQFFGAVSSATQFDLGFVQRFVDPSRSVSPSAAARLYALRVLLVTIWFLRKPTMVVSMKLARGCHNARDVALLAAGLVLYPISKSVDWLVKTLTAVEWATHRASRGGSEMYIVLVDPQ